MVDKELLDEAIELTKDIPATDLPNAVLTPLLSKEQSEDNTAYKVRIDWDILREPSPEKMVARLNQLSNQGWETVGGLVTQNTISGTIFYQLIKRAVAINDEAENNFDNETNGENSSDLDGLGNENVIEGGTNGPAN